jgi:hypothetical protein
MHRPKGRPLHNQRRVAHPFPPAPGKPKPNGKVAQEVFCELKAPPVIECDVPCIMLAEFLPECAECWAESFLPRDKSFLLSRAIDGPEIACSAMALCRRV